MVWRNDNQVCKQLPKGEVYMAEAVLGYDNLNDVLTNELGTNCRLVNLRDKIETYDGRHVAFRQLIRKNDGINREAFSQKMFDIIMFARKYIDYDINPLHFLSAWKQNTLGISKSNDTNWDSPRKVLKDVNTYSPTLVTHGYRYCSGLLSYLYCVSGIFNETEQRFDDAAYFPKHYSLDYKDTRFLTNFNAPYSLAEYQPELVYFYSQEKIK
jgi:hypothetical protein